MARGHFFRAFKNCFSSLRVNLKESFSFLSGAHFYRPKLSQRQASIYPNYFAWRNLKTNLLLLGDVPDNLNLPFSQAWIDDWPIFYPIE